jgi:hypothetical protein
MRRNKQELDVDFIGGEGPLTKEEEEAISAFLRSRKQKDPARKRISRPGNGKSSVEGTKVGQ